MALRRVSIRPGMGTVLNRHPQPLTGMDAQNVRVDAIPVEVGRGTVPGGRAKATGSDNTSLAVKTVPRHCFL
jgi:hypothetical protein